MVVIQTDSNNIEKIQEVIDSVDRLNELVNVTDIQNNDFNQAVISVKDEYIQQPLDWLDSRPPYLFPKIEYCSNHLLATIFFLLGNDSQSLSFIESESYKSHLKLAIEVKNHMPIDLSKYEEILRTNFHNKCISLHYGHVLGNLDQLINLYKEAVEKSTDVELKAFTLKHFNNLLLDHGLIDEIGPQTQRLLNSAISDIGHNELKLQIAYAKMQKISRSSDNHVLEEVAGIFNQCIEFYENRGILTKAAFVLMDAADIEMHQSFYNKSKFSLEKAVMYFKEVDLLEMMAEATVRLANLYYHMYKDGHNSYFKKSINAYQDALKVFKKERYPKKYADIHHDLGLIYSEIPSSTKEEAIWMAFSASSFKNALNHYNKNDYPYEYATICHNYGTALIKYGQNESNHDLNKAVELFKESLHVRNAKLYPQERAITLLNQLELYWILPIDNQKTEQERIHLMYEIVSEIKQLSQDESILQKLSILENRLKALKNSLQDA